MCASPLDTAAEHSQHACIFPQKFCACTAVSISVRCPRSWLRLQGMPCTHCTMAAQWAGHALQLGQSSLLTHLMHKEGHSARLSFLLISILC